MNEKLIERKLSEGVKARGCLAIKLVSPYFTGLPDRMILMPGGRIRFVELKTTGKKLSARQEIVTELLRRFGFAVAVIDSQVQIDEFLNDLRNDL